MSPDGQRQRSVIARLADVLAPRAHYPKRVISEAVRRLAEGLRRVVPFMPLLPLAVAGAFWTRVDRVQIVAWLAAAASVPLVRFILARRFLAQPPSEAADLQFANRITLTALVDGMIWGAAGWMFFVLDSVAHEVLLLTTIVGISAGSIFLTSYWPPMLHAYAVPAVGLVAARLITSGETASIAMGGAMLVYMVILFQISRLANRATLEVISLRFENLDLVDRLRAQKDLAEQANIAKSKLLAAASHDLRQPLHALGLFVEALGQRVTTPGARPLIDNINRSVGALEDLFDALLDVSKLDAGVVEPEVRNVPLDPLLSRLASEYEPQATAKGLRWRCDGGGLVVRSDPILLETILRNLLSNALRYTASGKVDIDCVRDGGKVHVRVSDTGRGIAPEHHRAIFREFYQLGNPERDRTKGLGLGLAIVDRLTRLLDHRIDVSSALGRGSTFALTLPAGAPIDADAPERAPDTVAADVARRVLVIDDEAAVREAMSVLLEDWGYDVTAAGSLDDALAQLESAPDVIVADYRLQEDQTGAAAIRALQQQFGADIPALIVTGDTAPERIAQAQDSGFALLHKPVPPAKLRAFLRTAGRQPAAGRAR